MFRLFSLSYHFELDYRLVQLLLCASTPPPHTHTHKHTHTHTHIHLFFFIPVGRTNSRRFLSSSMLAFCNSSFVSIPHAQALQQNTSAVWSDRTNDVPCWVLMLRALKIWYTLSFTSSFHLSAPVAPSSKSSSVGNDAAGDADADGVASAASWSTNSVSMSML